MDLGLEGETAVVTGAARGIGLAIARHLIAAGVDLATADRAGQHDGGLGLHNWIATELSRSRQGW